MDLLQRLKIETAPAHQRIEAALNIEGRSRSHAAYRELLARFYGLHAVWEPAAESASGEAEFLAPRRKTALLEQDLTALGLSPYEIAALPLCDPLMPLPSSAAAFGAAYVVEGSTLGGAIIARRVQQALGIVGPGSRYFVSYGPARGPMWKSFGAKLLSLSSPANDDAIVASANRTFAFMHDWLVGARP